MDEKKQTKKVQPKTRKIEHMRKFCYVHTHGKAEFAAVNVAAAKSHCHEIALAEGLNYNRDSVDFYEVK